MIDQTIINFTQLAIKELYGVHVLVESISLKKTGRDFSNQSDFTIVVFPFTKFSKKSPEQTGVDIANYLKNKISEIESFHVIKGFINMVISDSYWVNYLLQCVENKTYGFVNPIIESPVIIEYSSPNTNKPLHLGHIRNNLLGYSIAEILKANGKNVIKTTLVNDRGIHICKSMLAWQKWGEGETPELSGMKGDHLVGKYYVLFDKQYKQEIEDLKKSGLTQEESEMKSQLMSEAQTMLKKWETGDEEIIALWKTMNSWVYRGFDETYKLLGIDFDQTIYESDTYLLGKKIVEEGFQKKNFIKKDDGSVRVDLSAEGLDEKVLLRSDGTSVYITQDLGTAKMRFDDYKPEKMIYVVGNEQNYHFDVLKLVLKKSGFNWYDKVFHLSYGMVELPEGKMKSREGTVVDADDLINEMIKTARTTSEELGKNNESTKEETTELSRIIALAALKYFILKVDPVKNMMFNPQESIDFNGNTGPFIQYTYARIQSLISKSGAVKNKLPHFEAKTILPAEKEIIKLIYEFPEIVKLAGEKYSPALIANYSYELAKEFNQFYQEVPILKEEDKTVSNFRLCLASFTGQVICSSMKLLGIEVPVKM